MISKYLDKYSLEQRHRHDVRPGLTGYAQSNGRNGLSWPEKLSLDVEYTRKISFFLDLKIVFKTIYLVITRKGICSETCATMEEFEGNE